MRYNLVYTRRAEGDIKKLEPATKNRIAKALLRYSEEPLRFAEKYQTLLWGSSVFESVTTGSSLISKEQRSLY